MTQNEIWADKQPALGLFLQQIHTKDRVRKYDCFTNRYAFDSTLSIESGQAVKTIRVFAAVGRTGGSDGTA